MRIKQIILMCLLAYVLFTTFEFCTASALYMFSIIVIMLEAEYKAAATHK